MSIVQLVSKKSLIPYSLLINAIRKNNIKEAARLSKLTDINKRMTVRNYTDATPIFLAVLLGHAQIVRILYENGADSNLRVHTLQNNIMTPLILAAREGKCECVKALVNLKGKAVQTNRNFVPIARDSAFDIFSDSDDPDEEITVSALDEAVRGGSFECVEILIDHQATITLSTIEYLFHQPMSLDITQTILTNIPHELTFCNALVTHVVTSFNIILQSIGSGVILKTIMQFWEKAPSTFNKASVFKQFIEHSQWAVVNLCIEYEWPIPHEPLKMKQVTQYFYLMLEKLVDYDQQRQLNFTYFFEGMLTTMRRKFGAAFEWISAERPERKIFPSNFLYDNDVDTHVLNRIETTYNIELGAELFETWDIKEVFLAEIVPANLFFAIRHGLFPQYETHGLVARVDNQLDFERALLTGARCPLTIELASGEYEWPTHSIIHRIGVRGVHGETFFTNIVQDMHQPCFEQCVFNKGYYGVMTTETAQFLGCRFLGPVITNGGVFEKCVFDGNDTALDLRDSKSVIIKECSFKNNNIALRIHSKVECILQDSQFNDNNTDIDFHIGQLKISLKEKVATKIKKLQGVKEGIESTKLEIEKTQSKTIKEKLERQLTKQEKLKNKLKGKIKVLETEIDNKTDFHKELKIIDNSEIVYQINAPNAIPFKKGPSKNDFCIIGREMGTCSNNNGWYSFKHHKSGQRLKNLLHDPNITRVTSYKVLPTTILNTSHDLVEWQAGEPVRRWSQLQGNVYSSENKNITKEGTSFVFDDGTKVTLDLWEMSDEQPVYEIIRNALLTYESIYILYNYDIDDIDFDEGIWPLLTEKTMGPLTFDPHGDLVGTSIVLLLLRHDWSLSDADDADKVISMFIKRGAYIPDNYCELLLTDFEEYTPVAVAALFELCLEYKPIQLGKEVSKLFRKTITDKYVGFFHLVLEKIFEIPTLDIQSWVLKLLSTKWISKVLELSALKQWPQTLSILSRYLIPIIARGNDITDLHLDEIQQMVDTGIDLNIVEKDVQMPLIYVLELRNERLLQLLLNVSHFDPNVHFENENTAFERSLEEHLSRDIPIEDIDTIMFRMLLEDDRVITPFYGRWIPAELIEDFTEIIDILMYRKRFGTDVQQDKQKKWYFNPNTVPFHNLSQRTKDYVSADLFGQGLSPFLDTRSTTFGSMIRNSQEDVALKILYWKGQDLQYMSRTASNNPIICEHAVESDGDALQYVSIDRLLDWNIVTRAIIQNWNAFRWLPKKAIYHNVETNKGLEYKGLPSQSEVGFLLWIRELFFKGGPHEGEWENFKHSFPTAAELTFGNPDTQHGRNEVAKERIRQLIAQKAAKGPYTVKLQHWDDFKI